MKNPFETRRQCIAFICVSVAVVIGCVASIFVAEIFMPENLAGQQGVITFYRVFTPMIVVWGMLGVGAFFLMPEKQLTSHIRS